MKCIISYDISNPKRLRKVSRWLENYAFRLQNSVFTAELDEKTLNNVMAGLQAIIDDSEDCVCMFPICEADWQKRKQYGVQSPADEAVGRKYTIL